MNLSSIYNELSDLPTMMDVEQEREIFKKLLSIPIQDILSDERLFGKIIQEIMISWDSTCDQLSDEDKVFFSQVAEFFTRIAARAPDVSKNKYNQFSMIFSSF